MNEIIQTTYPTFQNFEYIALIAKTSSVKYPAILIEISKYPNKKINIENKTYHIVGFEKKVSDLVGLVNLIKLTQGLKGAFFYKKGLLFEPNIYEFEAIVKCASVAQNVSNCANFCKKIQINYYEDFFSSHRDFVIRITDEKPQSKLKKINKVIQTFPCKHIDKYYKPDNFNPYLYKDSLKESFLSYIFENNSEILECPFFNIERYKCEFAEEVIIVKE
ncbi:hypothetical protein [Nautilia sp.]